MYIGVTYSREPALPMMLYRTEPTIRAGFVSDSAHSLTLNTTEYGRFFSLTDIMAVIMIIFKPAVKSELPCNLCASVKI